MKKYFNLLLIITMTFLITACTNYQEVYNEGYGFLNEENYTELNETFLVLLEGDNQLYAELLNEFDDYVLEQFNELVSAEQFNEARIFINLIINEISHLDSSRYDFLEAMLLFSENKYYDSLKLLTTIEISDEDFESYSLLQRENLSLLVAEIFQYYWNARTISDYIFIEEQLKFVFSLLNDREKYLLTYSLLDVQWHHLNFELNDIFLDRFVKSEMPEAYNEFVEKNNRIESLTRIPSSTELANYLEPKAVIVNVFNASGRKMGSGSGFFINDNGLIVTNEHVIADASRVSIQMSNGNTHDVRILITDDRRDFAILKAPIRNNDFVTLGNSYQVQTGEPIYTYGSPLGISNTMTTGLVSKNLSIINLQEYIQITAPISPGSSGGMLVNEFGHVIGMTTAYLVNGQNMNLAIPINRVINLINEIDADIELSPKGNGHYQTLTAQTVREIYQFNYEESEELEKFGFMNEKGQYIYAMFNYANGHRYHGELKDGYFYGIGILENEEYFYHGQLENSQRHGFGITEYLNGSYYVGQHFNDELHGQGSYYWGGLEEELFGHVYIGNFENGIRNGKGIYLWPNGDIYEGDFVNDMRTGFGAYIWSNGSYFEGSFVDNQIVGFGIYVETNGDILEGNFVNGIINGNGILYFANGDIYEGNFLNGVRSGQGTMYYLNGDILEGTFVNGSVNGRAVLYFSSGNKYEGDFINGNRTGKGTLYFTNGNKYEGDFVNGNRTGKGTLYFNNGDIYIGDFISGSRTGKGTIFYANGNKYEGDFLGGVITGIGTFSFSNGSRYIGNFLDYNFSGYGEFYFTNGDIFKGNFFRGSPSGFGTHYFNSGARFAATWSSWNDGFGTFYFTDGSSQFARLTNGVFN